MSQKSCGRVISRTAHIHTGEVGTETLPTSWQVFCAIDRFLDRSDSRDNSSASFRRERRPRTARRRLTGEVSSRRESALHQHGNRQLSQFHVSRGRGAAGAVHLVKRGHRHGARRLRPQLLAMLLASLM